MNACAKVGGQVSTSGTVLGARPGTTWDGNPWQAGYAAVQVAVRRLAGRVARQKRLQEIMPEVPKEISDVEPLPPGLSCDTASPWIMTDEPSASIRVHGSHAS